MRSFAAGVVAVVLGSWALCACGGAASPPAPAPTVDGWDRAPSIVASRERSCVMLRDGGVACWGNGWSEPLGDGRTTDSPTPVRVVGLDSVIELSGANHTCALTATGDTFCWGPHVPTGVVGAESHAAMRVPTQQPLLGAIDLDAGSNHICVLATDGTMQCRSPADRPLIAIERRELRRFVWERAGLCVADRAGTLSCFKQVDDAYEPLPSPGLVVVDLARTIGGRDFLALRSDGQLVTKAPAAESWEPIETPGPVARLASATHSQHTCAVLATGGVVCWGANDRGQLGDGTREPRPKPTPVVGLDDAVAVAAGWSHSCAIRRNGRVSCWGANDRGQLGDGTIEPSLVPVDVLGLDLTATPEIDIAPPPDGLCLERDSDGDGISDRDERAAGYPCHYGQPLPDDGDGLEYALDDDSDGDGFTDRAESPGSPCASDPRDCDSDRVPSYFDRDSDNDGLWDEDEASLEAACTPDTDGDGCGDLAEHFWGDCALHRSVVRVGEASPDVFFVVSSAPRAPIDVTLHVEDLEPVRAPVELELDVDTIATASDSGAVTEDGGTFRGVRPGEGLRFSIVARERGSYFEGDTYVAQAALVLRDAAGAELTRGELLIVVPPAGGSCPGP